MSLCVAVPGIESKHVVLFSGLVDHNFNSDRLIVATVRRRKF
jgi:hypothetical protein